MKVRLTVFLGLFFVFLTAKSQTLSPNADAYNWPYDSLIVYGDKGISSGLILGVESPHMGMMFYNRAIEIQPENPYAYERKGKAYLDFKMLDEASEAFNQCLELEPGNAKCLHGIFAVSAEGTTKYELGQIPLPMLKQTYNSAVAFLKVAPASMANEIAYAELLGYTLKLGIDNQDAFQKYCPLVLTEKFDEVSTAVAIEILPAVQATGNNQVLANLYNKVCQFYFNNNDVAKTKEYGLRGISSEFAFASTYYYLGYTYYYDDKNTDAAIKMLEDGIMKKGVTPASSGLLATIQYTEGKAAYLANNFPKAITLLSKLVSGQPENLRANALLGFACYNSKKFADAAKYLNAVKSLANPANVNIYFPNLTALIAFAEKPATTAPAIKTTLFELEKNELIYNEGEKLLGQQNYTGAIEKYSQALTYYVTTNDIPMMEQCNFSIGYSYHLLENFANAKEYYIKSIDLGCAGEFSYNYYALILYAVDGNYELAETMLNNGLAKFPSSESLPVAKGKMFISKAYDVYNTKDYAGAIPYFLKGLELNLDARAYIYLGYSYSESNNIEEAVSAWNNAFYYDPELANEFSDVYNWLQSRQ